MDRGAAEQKFKTHAFAIIRSMIKSTNNTASQQLARVVQSTEPIIEDYKQSMRMNMFTVEEALLNEQNQRKLDFLNRISADLDHMYTNFFKQIEEAVSNSFSIIEERSKVYQKAVAAGSLELNALLSSKIAEFNIEMGKIDAQYTKEIDEIQERINKVTASAKERTKEEENRVKEHFAKQLKQRDETLSMLKTSLEKADEELRVAVEVKSIEVKKVMDKNDAVLSEHRESVNSKLLNVELTVQKLESELETLEKTKESVQPEIEDEYNKMIEGLKKQFREEDDKYEREMNTQKELLGNLQKRLSELEEEREDFAWKSETELSELKEKNEDEYAQLEETLRSQLESESILLKDKYDQKLARMKENVERLRSSIEEDIEDFNSRSEDRIARHTERLNTIQEQHQEEVKQLSEEIEGIKKEIVALKQEWMEEKKKIEESYDTDIQDIKAKEVSDEKYFDSKMSALRKELQHVIEENKKIIGVDEIEIALESSRSMSSETGISSRLSQEMSAVVEEHVKGKLQALRDKHEKEKLLLLNEAADLEKDESVIQLKISEMNKRISSSSSKSKISALFSSSSFLDAQVEKWREDFLIDSKNLRIEEADILKKLDNTKVEFKAAIERTLSLKKKLKASTESYEATINEMKTKSADQIAEINESIAKKEKEIAELERQFTENEKEVRKKVRQIENAEDRLVQLRTKLSEEKVKIKEVIKKEFQPLIKQEQRRSELIVSDLEKLRNELELAIEFAQHDLFFVESSNAAMEEGLRKETEEMVQQLRSEIIAKNNQKEEEEVEKMNKAEMEKLEYVNNVITELEKSIEEKEEEARQEVESVNSVYKQKLGEINDMCVSILAKNTVKKDKIKELLQTKCDLCPVLDKNIRKLEKILIQLQCSDQMLEVEEKYRRDTIKAFHQKTRLPPLSASSRVHNM